LADRRKVAALMSEMRGAPLELGWGEETGDTEGDWDATGSGLDKNDGDAGTGSGLGKDNGAAGMAGGTGCLGKDNGAAGMAGGTGCLGKDNGAAELGFRQWPRQWLDENTTWRWGHTTSGSWRASQGIPRMIG
jgi:hypothetical protein